MPSLGRASAVWGWGPALVILAIFFVGYGGQRETASVAPDPTFVAPAASPSALGPSATFDVESVDLGRVPPGEAVTYSFHVGNTGQAPLVIESTTAKALEGCGPPPPKVVGPTTLQTGEETDVVLSVSMAGEMAGPHLFEITVKTNDPQNVEKKLLMRVNWASGWWRREAQEE